MTDLSWTSARTPGAAHHSLITLSKYAETVDSWLLAAPPRVRSLVIALTIIVMVVICVPLVPRPYVDYAQLPLLRHIPQYDSYGTDTIGDLYVAKVVVNDPSDMYTKRKLEQTPLERATFSREASAPYPPVALLAEAGLYVVGKSTGVGFYGTILMLAIAFLGLSLFYFLKTRWYLFPILYLNFSYYGLRFVYVQDNTYLIMLIVVMAALFLARYRQPASHALMAVAITMKASPLYYVKNVFAMSRAMAAVFVAILFVGLVFPYFIWDNYLDIYRFHAGIKGNAYDTLAAVVIAVPFSLMLWYVETRLKFDMEDRIGWGLVPFAMFLGLKMRVTRHLIMALLVPDKRGIRNVAAAVGMACHSLLPRLILFGSVLYITTGLLIISLIYFLDQVGWDTVHDDFRHPARTARMMLSIHQADHTRAGSP